MADYDIFREQLSIKYSTYGHALWEPSPAKPNNPVKVGDVGFIRDGAFHCLFNALLSVEDQSDNVPEHYEQLLPKFSNHIRKSTLSSNHYCSDGISVKLEPNVFALGPDDFEEVSFSTSRRRGAVLSLPVDARREDTLAKGDFSGWIVKHIDRWFAFARELGLGIERMEEIILASFGVNVVRGPAISINWQPLPERVQGAVLHRGPDGMNLPEDQCVFIRGFRVARTFWMLPKHLKAAAGPSPDVGGYDCEPDIHVVSIPATPKYQDPLHILQDYVAERASDCDMVLVHDDDLVTIDELSHGVPPETLEPDVMTDLLRRSNIEIYKVSYDLSQTNSGPNTERSVVKVAMLSVTSQNWNTASPSQWSSLSAQNIDLGHTSESRDDSTSSLPGSLPVPMIRGETSNRETSLSANHGGNVPFTQQDLADSPLRRVWQATEDIFLALGKIKRPPSDVWPSLSKLAHMERNRLLTVVIITCCAVSLLGWAFSSTWDVFKIFFSLLLASFPLSVWFERENRYRRQLDNIYERLEALQHQVSSLQLDPTVPDAVTDVSDVRYSLPIIARTIPANLDMLVQSSVEGTIQPTIPEGNTDDRSEESIMDLLPPSRIHLPARKKSLPSIRIPAPSLPPTNVRRKPRSSNFLNRIKYAFAPSPSTKGSIRLPEDVDAKTEGAATKRRALLVGISYSTPSNTWSPLDGPHGDVDRYRDLLINTYGWRPEDIVVLKDLPEFPALSQPTRVNMIRELKALVSNAAQDDKFTFFYSGHSDQQVAIIDRQEEDDMDEMLITSDEETIIDDELKEILVDPLPVGCTLIAIFDASHSGTMLDLPHHHCNSVYVPWQSKGRRRTVTLRNMNVRRQAMDSSNLASLPPQSIESAIEGQQPVQSLQPGTQLGEGHPAVQRELSLRGRPRERMLFSSQTRYASPEALFACDGWCKYSDVPHPNVLSLSACSDLQRTWEGPNGSLTTVLCNYLKKYSSPSYGALMAHINFQLHDNALALHEYTRHERKRSHLGQADRFDGELDNFQQPELSSLVRLNMDDILRL